MVFYVEKKKSILFIVFDDLRANTKIKCKKKKQNAIVHSKVFFLIVYIRLSTDGTSTVEKKPKIKIIERRYIASQNICYCCPFYRWPITSVYVGKSYTTEFVAPPAFILKCLRL